MVGLQQIGAIISLPKEIANELHIFFQLTLNDPFSDNQLLTPQQQSLKSWLGPVLSVTHWLRFIKEPRYLQMQRGIAESTEQRNPQKHI